MKLVEATLVCLYNDALWYNLCKTSRGLQYTVTVIKILIIHGETAA